MKKYEYSMFVKPIVLTPGIGDATSDEVARDLSQVFARLIQDTTKALELPDFREGWEIISHDVTRLDRHVVITFLLRRELSQT